ncbi:MAG: hypothetical protein IKG15_00310 [Solobacterium sp.]|nr:hypothetical protein [Solobacterium sp.]
MKKLIDVLKEKFMNRRFLTFGIIGVVNTLLAQLLYMLFVTLGIQVSAAAFPLSYVPGITINAAAAGSSAISCICLSCGQRQLRCRSQCRSIFCA